MKHNLAGRATGAQKQMEDILQKELGGWQLPEKDFNLARTRRFLYRTRYFTDSGIIGTKEFIRIAYNLAKQKYDSKKDKTPKRSAGWVVFIL